MPLVRSTYNIMRYAIRYHYAARIGEPQLSLDLFTATASVKMLDSEYFHFQMQHGIGIWRHVRYTLNSLLCVHCTAVSFLHKMTKME